MHENQADLKSIIHRRATKGLLAKLLNKTMPPDPKPYFVYPELVAEATRQHFRVRKLAVVALLLLVSTIGMIALLLQVPYPDWSVVKLLTHGFETFLPEGWATAAAWIIGILATMFIGSFTDHNYVQRMLLKRQATKYKLYNLVLLFALEEEQVFRSGSEKWSWPQRIRASLIFGVIHITNIWYSLAAGIALGLTGFGLLMVYLWYYRKTKNQIIATSASTTVHAIYNMMVLALLSVLVVASITFGFFL